MHSTDTKVALPLPHSWIAAGFALAFMFGISLSIPLLNKMSAAPTGYDPAVSSEDATLIGRALRAQSVIQKHIAGFCLHCTVSRERVPAEASPSVFDPLVAMRGFGEAEV